ncbi:MAG TPA: hypothetical protein VLV16_11875 [Gemmatimonadales bacterium]|nr:hypothetical protein [Gemmatimonadales bacterium]
MLRRVALVAAALLAAGHPLTAQNSQFGINTIGSPGRPESVRARSTGGAFAAFDAMSAVADVALTDVKRLTASAVGWSAIRDISPTGGKTQTLKESRFPLFTLAGPIGPYMVLGGGFGSYLDHSYDLITRDSTLIRGDMVKYVDENIGDGGVTDVRFALAAKVGPRLAIGLGVHGLTGSDRLTAIRVFDSLSAYAPVRDTNVVKHTGFGMTASVRLEPFYGVSLVGFVRSDGKLDVKVNENPRGTTDLPLTVGAAVRLILKPGLRVAGSVTRSTWSVVGVDSYNTMDWAVGTELGGAGFAVRLGARGGQFPFATGGSAPSEIAVSAGLGRTFASGHGVLDFGVERLQRSGTGLDEGVWTLMTGFTVRQ